MNTDNDKVRSISMLRNQVLVACLALSLVQVFF